MPDETNPAAAPESQQQAPSQSAGETPDLSGYQALVEKLRPFEKEADRLKKANAALEAKVSEFERSKLSDTERLQAERDAALKTATEAQKRAQERAVRADVVIAATKLNIVDPDAAYRLLDAGAIEFDDAGDPKNIAALLTDLVKAKPYLIAQTATASSGNPMNPSRGNGEPPAETDAQKRARLYGGGARNLFTVAGAASHGGGVYRPTDKP